MNVGEMYLRQNRTWDSIRSYERVLRDLQVSQQGLEQRLRKGEEHIVRLQDAASEAAAAAKAAAARAAAAMAGSSAVTGAGDGAGAVGGDAGTGLAGRAAGGRRRGFRGAGGGGAGVAAVATDADSSTDTGIVGGDRGEGGETKFGGSGTAVQDLGSRASTDGSETTILHQQQSSQSSSTDPATESLTDTGAVTSKNAEAVTHSSTSAPAATSAAATTTSASDVKVSGDPQILREKVLIVEAELEQIIKIINEVSRKRGLVCKKLGFLHAHPSVNQLNTTQNYYEEVKITINVTITISILFNCLLRIQNIYYWVSLLN